MNEISDAELLRIEMDTLWGEDLYGRTEQKPQVVVLATPVGSRAYVSEELPRDIALRLEAVSATGDGKRDPSQPPGSWNSYRELLVFRSGRAGQRSGCKSDRLNHAATPSSS